MYRFLKSLFLYTFHCLTWITFLKRFISIHVPLAYMNHISERFIYFYTCSHCLTWIIFLKGLFLFTVLHESHFWKAYFYTCSHCFTWITFLKGLFLHMSHVLALWQIDFLWPLMWNKTYVDHIWNAYVSTCPISMSMFD